MSAIVMHTLVKYWPVVIGVAIVAGGGLWWVKRRPSAEDRMSADARDPYRRWVQNVFLLVTGSGDHGHLHGAEARRMLAHWWDVYGPLEHRRTLAELAHSPNPSHGRDHAWNLVRFILVSRLGAAMGLYDDELSWDDILPIARRLQAAYPSWRAMAQAYLRARRQASGLPLDGSEDDQGMLTLLENLAVLDDTRWAELDFHTPLHTADPENP